MILNSKLLPVFFLVCLSTMGGLKAQEVDSKQKAEYDKFAFNGLENFEHWTTIGGHDNNDWVLEDGKLICKERGAHILQQLELPEVSKIDMAISYENGKLDFVFGLGAPADKVQAGRKLLKVESWEDSLVLNSSDDFSIIYETIPEERMELSITFDRLNNVVTIADANGKQLCKTQRLEAGSVAAGVYLEDRHGSGSLKIEQLTIAESKSHSDDDGIDRD